MPQPKNAMEIFQQLNKSNCRDCHEATCLAFAGAVFTGRRKLEECPHLDREVIERFSGEPVQQMNMEDEAQLKIDALKQEVAQIDLLSAARRLGASFDGKKITVKILGKDFSIDTDGRLTSDIHIHSWVTIPFLNGKWVPLRELPRGADWYRLFNQRCEKALKRVADDYTDLFEDMIHIFNGKQVKDHYESDISLVLHPLPLVPILICYWKPEDGLESDLNLFFDSTAEENLNIESIYAIGAGLTSMFEKLSLRHGLA